LRDADEIVNGIKQNGIADGNFMAIPCFFSFQKALFPPLAGTLPSLDHLSMSCKRKHRESTHSTSIRSMIMPTIAIRIYF
jgi:hypothetical protein